MLSRDPAQGHRERGQVILLFALLIPVLFGLGSIVLSVGNWYVHKKHLQTLVDAGAFAGGTAFSACHLDPTGTNAQVASTALEYSGDPTRDPTTENAQVQQPNDVHVVLNSNRYWSKGDPTDGSTFDNTLGTPCDERFLDVKGTDLELPLIWRWLPLFPTAKTKARVEIQQVIGLNGMLPWAVPEVDPEWVGALIVNESVPATSANSVVGAAELGSQSPVGSWNTFGGLVSDLALSAGHYGVVIVVSRDVSQTPVQLMSGSLDEICSRNPVQTKCWSGSTPTSGLSFIRAYSDPGAAVAINSVDLSSSACPNSASAPYFALNGPCSVSITRAIVNFGVNGDPTGMPTCGRVTAAGSPLTFHPDASISPQGGYWDGPAFTLSQGRNPVTMTVEVKRANGNNCSQLTTATSELVAAPYLADDNSGPVEYLRVDNALGGSGNNINKSPPNRSFYITVGLTPPFQVTDNWDDPDTYLRITSNSSQTQAVDCDSNNLVGPTGLQHSNFRNEIIDGCLTFYIENDRNGDCSNYGFGSLPPPTTLSNPIDDCVVTQTGVSAGQIRQAIDTRFGFDGGAQCKTTNNWPTSDPNADPNDNVVYPDPLTDKRYVVLFIVDDTAFTGSGQQIFPVRRFGGFYLTGADGLNCPGDDPPPPGGRQASAWGHFMTYVSPDPDAILSNELCEFDEVGTCVAVLVE